MRFQFRNRFFKLQALGRFQIYLVVLSEKCTESLLFVFSTFSFWFYMAGLALLIGPFCFFDFQQTKWLQYTTMLVRNASLFAYVNIQLLSICKDDDIGNYLYRFRRRDETCRCYLDQLVVCYSFNSVY